MLGYDDPQSRQATKSASRQADNADDHDWTELVSEAYWEDRDPNERIHGRHAGPLSKRVYKALGNALTAREDTRIHDRKGARKKVVETLAPLLDKNEAVLAGFESGCVELSMLGPSFALTELKDFAHDKGGDYIDTAGAARGWDRDRGVTRSGPDFKTSHVVFSEENVMGYDVGDDVGKHGFLPNIELHSKGYSILTHEFAHGLHRSNALMNVDVSDLGNYVDVKDMISQCFANVRQGVEVGTKFDQAGQYWYCLIPDEWPAADDPGTKDRVMRALWLGHVDGPCFSARGAKSDRIYIYGRDGSHWQFPGGMGVPTLCYSSSSEAEYFAQSVNCYLGTNTGKDPFTGRDRFNGEAWLRRFDPHMHRLLDRLFARGAERATVQYANPRGGVQ